MDTRRGNASMEVETGGQENLWKSGLGNGYPCRPDEPDCVHYLRTGVCGYGSRCRYNHPPQGSVTMGEGEYPERVGKPVCQFYMKTGTCKYGATCKYHHPKHVVGSSAPVTMNIHGYPSRPGEKECSYYVKTGQCRFGVNCKFHHPHAPQEAPAPIQIQSPQQHKIVNWPPMLPCSYIPGNYGTMLLSPGIVHVPGWTPFPATYSSGSTLHQSGVSRISQLSATATAYVAIGASNNAKKDSPAPERPGQEECQEYLKTGMCKFGAACEYLHPSEQISPWSNFMPTPMMLPLHPIYYYHMSKSGYWSSDHASMNHVATGDGSTNVAQSSEVRLELLSEGEESNE